MSSSRSHRRCIFLLLLGLALPALATSVEDFDQLQPGNPAPGWDVVKGGGTGCGDEDRVADLLVASGDGFAAGENYGQVPVDLTPSDCYTEARFDPATPIHVEALEFYARISGAALPLVVRVVDSVGETYQYSLPYHNHRRYAEGEWERVYVRLDRMWYHWGTPGPSEGPTQPLTQINILVDNEPRMSLTSVLLELDDVVFHDSIERRAVDPFAVADPAERQRPFREVASVNVPNAVPLTGNHEHRIDRIVDAGFGKLRRGVIWESVLPIDANGQLPADYDWSAWDALLAELKEPGRDIQPLLLIAYGHEYFYDLYEHCNGTNPTCNPGAPLTWCRPAGTHEQPTPSDVPCGAGLEETPWKKNKWGPTAPEYVQAFADYAAAVAAHFADEDVMFEIWNEPNGHDNFWLQPAGYIGAADDYIDLVEAAVSAMRAVDPDCRVHAGATSWVDYEYLADVFINDKGLPALSDIDDLSFHAYRHAGPGRNELEHPETVGRDIPGIRRLVQDLTGRVEIPLVISEWGIWSNDWFDPARTVDFGRATLDPSIQADVDTAERRRARWAVRQLLHNQLIDVEYGSFFRLLNPSVAADAADAENHHGLLYSDESPTPSFDALVALKDRIGGKPFLGTVNAGAVDMFGALYGDGAEQTTVLWNAREGTSADLRLALYESAGFHDMDGLPDPGSVQVDSECGIADVSLSEEDGPLYVTRTTGATALSAPHAAATIEDVGYHYDQRHLVALDFSECVDATVAADTANYHVFQTSNPAVTKTVVWAGVAGGLPRSKIIVVLDSPVKAGKHFSIRVRDVADLYGNVSPEQTLPITVEDPPANPPPPNDPPSGS